MQRTVIYTGLLMLIAACLGIFGCGDSDVLDEIGWRWAIRESPVVNDGDTERHQIDLNAEGDASVTFVVSSNEDNDTDLYIHEIILDIELTGSSGTAHVFGRQTYTTAVGDWLDSNGGTYTFTAIFLTAGGKLGVLNDLGLEYDDTYWADYNVKITVHGSFSSDSSDNDVTIEDSTWFTITPMEEAATETTYTVTYDGNGADGGSDPVDGNDYADGDTVTVLNSGTLSNSVDPTFDGWNTQADGTGTAYDPGDTFTMGTADVTLYAIWN